MRSMKLCFLAFLACSLFTGIFAADIQLPKPAKTSSLSLYDALALRRSGRSFSSQELPPVLLSSLLWAANGINRPDGRRTAPTGLNVQDIDIYVILPQACYLYDAQANLLRLVKEGDFRGVAGKQAFVAPSPVNLVYVQDLSKSMKADEKTQARHGGLHAGAIMQNVYLFCAANGLISVARDSMDREGLTAALNLKDTQKIMLAQTVGFDNQLSAVNIDQATAIALKHAGVPQETAKTLPVKQKYDDDDRLFEIEFKYQGFEYEYEIDAATGTIKKSEIERD